MDLYSLPVIAAVLDAAYRALMSLTHLLEPLAGAAAAATAVVVITLAVRAALIPVGVSQAKAERDRARLAPQLAELQRRYRRHPEKLQRATMELYAKEGTSPLAGCLPMLLHVPVVGALYAVFVHAQIAGHANALLAQTLGSVPLGTSLAQAVTGGVATGSMLAVFGVVVLLIAGAAELTRRAMAPGAALAAASVPTAAQPGASANPLSGAAMQRALRALPFATAVIACVVPLAAGLYLVVTVWWTLGQRLLLRRRYPVVTTSGHR